MDEIRYITWYNAIVKNVGWYEGFVLLYFFTFGRPTKKERRRFLRKRRSYRKKGELSRMATRYFDEYLPTHENEIPDVESFAVFLGISREELMKFDKEELEMVLTRIAGVKKQLAMKGKIPASVFTFDFKNNHGYGDKSEAKDEAISVSIVGKAVDWSS